MTTHTLARRFTEICHSDDCPMACNLEIGCPFETLLCDQVSEEAWIAAMMGNPKLHDYADEACKM